MVWGRMQHYLLSSGEYLMMDHDKADKKPLNLTWAGYSRRTGF